MRENPRALFLELFPIFRMEFFHVNIHCFFRFKIFLTDLTFEAHYNRLEEGRWNSTYLDGGEPVPPKIVAS